jgi:dienelactone hydrolase
LGTVACGTETTPPDDRQPVERLLWVEAETLEGDWFEQTNLRPFSGTGFRVSRTALTGRGSPLIGTVRLSTGTVTLWARGYRDESDRRFRVEVDDRPLTPTHGPAPETDAFVWQRAGSFELDRPGPVSFRVFDAGDGYEVVDTLVFVQGGQFSPSADSRAALPLDFEQEGERMEAALVGRLRRQVDEALSDWPTEPGTEAWANRAAAFRSSLREALGIDDLVRRRPAPRRVDTVRFEGYRMEKLVFEAFPGFEMPASYFVPDAPGPHPAVLSSLSHHLGKSHPLTASRAHALARLGFVVLTFDPFGDEERRMGGNEHWLQPLLSLSGLSNTGVHVHETLHAVDWLLAQSEVDATMPLSMTGNSLGGLVTLYAAAVDPRVEVTAPSGYVVGLPELAATRGFHDECSYVPGVAALGGMRAMAAVRAPDPQLLLIGARDTGFPAAGTTAVVSQLSPWWSAAGRPDRLALAMGEGGHDMTRPQRERLYGFLNGFVRSDEDGGRIAEPAIELPDNAWVTEDGRVSDAFTLLDLAEDRAVNAIAALPSPERMSPRALTEAVSAVGGPIGMRAAELERSGSYVSPWGTPFDRWVVDHADARTSALVHSLGPQAPVAVVVLGPVHDFGTALQTVLHQGFSAVGVRVRGLGDGALRTGWYAPTLEWTGHSLPSERATDLVAAWSALRQTYAAGPNALGPWSVALPRDAATSLSTLLLQAETPSFSAVATGPIQSSWLDGFGRFPPRDLHVPDALSHADLVHLVWAASVRPLRWTPRTPTWADLFPDAARALREKSFVAEDGQLEARLAWARERYEDGQRN